MSAVLPNVPMTPDLVLRDAAFRCSESLRGAAAGALIRGHGCLQAFAMHCCMISQARKPDTGVGMC